jgi:hypothetical protein
MSRALPDVLPQDPPHILVMSARDPEALAETCRRLAARLDRDPGLDPADVATTLLAGRERFAFRHAVLGRDISELRRALAETAVSDRQANPATEVRLCLADRLPPAALASDGACRILPPVRQALATVDTMALSGDVEAARVTAIQYGVGCWLATRGVIPAAITGEGPGALAAEALRGRLSLPAALRASASPSVTPRIYSDEGSGATEEVVLRIARDTADDTDSFGDLLLDLTDPLCYADVLARLWCLGLEVDTSLGRIGRRVRLPGYPFRRVTADQLPTEGEASRALTPHEQRWLFYDIARSGSTADHLRSCASVFSGPPPARPDLEAAFSALQQRHPVLRTVFARDGGQWCARTVQARTRPEWLDPVEAAGPDGVLEVAQASAGEPMDLLGAPQIRCCVTVGATHWAVALAVYEPLLTCMTVEQLLAELLDPRTGQPRAPAPSAASDPHTDRRPRLDTQ